MKKNMLRDIAFAALPLFAAVLFAGCTTISELPPEDVKKQGDTPEFALGRDMLIAFLRNDAKGFVSHLSPEKQKQFNTEMFSQTRADIVKNLGEPVSFRFLTTLEMVAFQPNIWVIRFKRVNPVSKKEFYQEVLFSIVTGRIDGKVQVISFRFK